MIRLRRTLRRQRNGSREATGGGEPHLRLVVPERGETEEVAPEQTESPARRTRAPKTADDDSHSWVRTYVDPRNIYLA